jgi:subtilisin family serine protease
MVTAPAGLGPGLREVQLGSGVRVGDALRALRADPAVLEAQPDPIFRVTVTPNDPLYRALWDLSSAIINAAGAWNVTTGNPRTVVSIIDTGIDYNHPDLYQNIWINQAEIPPGRRRNLIDVDHDGIISFRDLNDRRNQGRFKITDVNHDGRIDAADILAPMVRDRFGRDTGLGGWAYPGNVQDGDTAHPNDFIGWNFINNTNNPFDDNGHGTHVAGTIGAMGDNGVGIVGINWQVQLMALKVFDGGGAGPSSADAAALNYAVAHGSKISNNSYGGPFSPVLYNAVRNARAYGHVFIAAAGNNGINNDGPGASFPSSFNLDNVLAVAATDKNDRLASFSDYDATTVDLAAPGVDILSTTPHNTYSVFSGTSMAAPHMTGVVALVWGLHPNWTYAQVIHQVLSTVDVLPGLRGKTVTGGRLDAAATVSRPLVRPRSLDGIRHRILPKACPTCGNVGRLKG